MRIPKVDNMYSSKGTYNKVANQYVIDMPNGDEVFQSYRTIIAIKKRSGEIVLDKDSWNYSVTTSRYRNEFLGENTAETRRKIANGTYQLKNLNK